MPFVVEIIATQQTMVHTPLMTGVIAARPFTQSLVEVNTSVSVIL
jgi:hypothetical protein